MKFFLVIFFLPIVRVYSQSSGPFDIVMHKLDECEDTGTHEAVFYYKTKQVNRTTLHITGYATLPYGLTDKVLCIMSVGTVRSDSEDSSEVTAGKEIFTKNFGGLCSALRTYAPDLGRQIFKMFGYQPNQCPKKGNYSMDHNIEFILANIPIMIYGKYRLNYKLLLASNYKKIGCFYAIAEFKPKKGRRKNKGK